MLVPWKTGDTEPLRLRLTRNGRGQDLSQITGIVFNMVPVVAGAGSTITRGAVEVVGATTGDVAYHWAAGETDVAGAHRAEVEVTWADGTIKTFPDGGHIDLIISHDLG